MLSRKRLSDPSTVLTAAASFAATAMLIRSIANDLIPNGLRSYFSSSIDKFSRKFSSKLTIVIEEFQGHSTNEMFVAIYAYLGTKVTPYIQRIKASKGERDTKLVVTVDRDEEIVDVYGDVPLIWTLVCKEVESPGIRNRGDRKASLSLRSEVRSYELNFHQKHREMVLNSYLPYIWIEPRSLKKKARL